MDDIKTKLAENIQQWLVIDNEVKQLNKQLKQLRARKKLLTKNLVTIMKTHSIDDISLQDEKILYTQTRGKTPLSKKHLFSSISIFLKDDAKLANKLAQYIMNTRKDKISENIRRKNIK